MEVPATGKRSVMSGCSESTVCDDVDRIGDPIMRSNGDANICWPAALMGGRGPSVRRSEIVVK